MLALACAAAWLGGGPLAAQLPLSLEGRGGVAVPAETFAGADGGVAVEVSATWHALPLVGIYGAYQGNRFGREGTEDHATDRGFAAGVRVAVPTPLIPIDPWIRAGLVTHRLRAEGLAHESEPGVEVGAGLAFPLARRITLTPGVLWTRYRHGATADQRVRVRHLRADVGLRMHL